jgi:hypothetical protein
MAKCLQISIICAHPTLRDMAENKRSYYGHYSEEELMNLMMMGDAGAFFEVMSRAYQPLSMSISEILIAKITDKEPLEEYAECLLYAEYCADKIAHNTMMLMWGNKEYIANLSLYQSLLKVLKMELSLKNGNDFLTYTEDLEIKILSNFLLQPAQIKRDKALKRYFEKWKTTLDEADLKMFDMRFIAGMKSNQISEALKVSLPAVEAQLHKIYGVFEEHLKIPYNRIFK